MNATQKSPSRRRRRWLRWLLALFLLAAALIAATPWLLSSLGRGTVLGVVGNALGTNVEAASLSLSWTGPQSITMLRVASPEGYSEDLVRLERAQIEAGLLGLVFSGGDPIGITIEKPALHLERSADGRFNFDFLVDRPAEPERKPPPREEAPRPPEPDLPEEITLPKLPRALALVVRDGNLSYRDALLETAASIEEIEIDVEAGEKSASLVARAAFHVDGSSESGSLDASGHLAGLGKTQRLSDLELEARIAGDRVPLPAFRGLIEERLGLRVGDEAVSGSLGISVTGGVLRADGELSSEVLDCERFSATIPLEAPGELLASAPRCTLSLDRLAALIEPLGVLPAGARLGGEVEASLEAKGESALLTLARKGAVSLGEAELQLGAVVRELDVLYPLPPSEAAHADSGEAAAAREPVRLQDPEVRLRLQARGDPAGGALRIETLTVRAAAGEVDLAGRLFPDGKEPEVQRVELEGRIAASLSELGRIARPHLPPETTIAEATRLEVSDLRIAGPIAGDGFVPQRWSSHAHLKLDGNVAVETIALEGAEADLVFEAGTASLENALARLNGGRITPRTLTVNLAEEPTPFEVDLDVEDVGAVYEMTPLLQYAIPFLNLEGEKAVFDGKLAAKLNLRGRGFDEEALRSALSGGGMIRVRNGTVAASRFFEEVASLLGGELASVAFSELGSDFRIGEGRVVAEKVFLHPRAESKLRNLGLKGSTGLDRSLDFGVDLAALHETIGDKKIRRVLEAAQRFLKDDMLPLKLRGSLDSPKLSLDLDLDSQGIGGLLEAIPGLEPRANAGEDGRGADKKKTSTERVLEDVLEGIFGGEREKKKD